MIKSVFQVFQVTAWQLTACQLPDNCLATAWQLTDTCLTPAWQLPDNCPQNSCRLKSNLPTGNMTAEIIIFFLSSWTRTALSRKSWSSLWRTFAAIASNCLSKFSLGIFLVFMSNVGSINSSGLTISFCLTTANFLNSSKSTIDPLLQNSWKNCIVSHKIVHRQNLFDSRSKLGNWDWFFVKIFGDYCTMAKMTSIKGSF